MSNERHFSFFVKGPYDLHVSAKSPLELLDKLLSWKHYDRFRGTASGWNSRWHSGWHCPPESHKSNDRDLLFDGSRAGDLEYVEMMVVRLWEALDD